MPDIEEHNFISKPSKSVDYKGIIMIALVIAGMAGALIAATIAPMNSNIAKHDMQIMSELKDNANQRYESGVRDGTLASMKTVITEFMDITHNRLMSLETDVSEQKATIVYAVRHIYSVDERGNRRDVIDPFSKGEL